MSQQSFSLLEFPLPNSPLNIFLLGVSLLSLILAILLYFFQGKLIYIPQLPPGSRAEVWLPSRFGYGPGLIKFSRKKCCDHKHKDDDIHEHKFEEATDTTGNFAWEELELVTPDKVKLQAYWLKAPSKFKDNTTSSSVKQRNTDNPNTAVPYTILYMQANAGNIGHRLPIAKKLQETVDCNVLLLSYRGYGKSSGTPSEKGIKIDSQTALDYVWSILDESERAKVIVYGQSIGGAVAIHLAHLNPGKIRTLIVENTFLSIPSLIPSVAPILGPFAFLCTERWNSAALVPQLRQKCLFLSGSKDELIPPSHMAKLHQSARASLLKRIVHFQKGMHNDTCIQQGYFEAIEDFLNAKFSTPRVIVEEITDDEQAGGSI